MLAGNAPQKVLTLKSAGACLAGASATHDGLIYEFYHLATTLTKATIIMMRILEKGGGFNNYDTDLMLLTFRTHVNISLSKT